MKLTGENRQLGEKPVPVPLCPPQTPHGLIRDRTRASAVEGRRLTAWAMARPLFMCFVWISEQTALVSLYNTYWMVFITETECVYCAVWTESLSIIQVILRFVKGCYDNSSQSPINSLSIYTFSRKCQSEILNTFPTTARQILWFNDYYPLNLLQSVKLIHFSCFDSTLCYWVVKWTRRRTL
jgi:hypothetical protein